MSLFLLLQHLCPLFSRGLRFLKDPVDVDEPGLILHSPLIDKSFLPLYCIMIQVADTQKADARYRASAFFSRPKSRLHLHGYRGSSCIAVDIGEVECIGISGDRKDHGAAGRVNGQRR